MTPWQKILAGVVRSRFLRPRAAPERFPSIGRTVGGFLLRLLLLVLLVFMAFVGAMFLFGHALLQGWRP